MMRFFKIRRFALEWWLIAIGLCTLLVGVARSSTVGLMNDYLYDHLLTMHARAADDRVVIVDIDESSIQHIGAWPLDRKVYAQALNELAKAQPKGVLLDVLFLEPSKPESDQALGRAMAGLPQMASPILIAGDDLIGRSTLPIDEVRNAAQLGSISIILDHDGVMRQVPLYETDDAGQTWPLLTTLLLNSPELLPRERMLRVPFNVPVLGYQHVSFEDVLNQKVDLSQFKDKYILIGTSATGLGDRYNTPNVRHSGTMAGVEIHANILDALLNQLSVKSIDGVVWVIVPVLLLLILLVFLPERWHLWAFLALGALYLSLVAGLLWLAYIWLPPFSTLLGLLCAYVLWSWRRLAVLLTYTNQQLIALRQHTGLVGQLMDAGSSRGILHTLDQNIAQTRFLSHFIDQSLYMQPIALCLVDEHGRILMFNSMATSVIPDIALGDDLLLRLSMSAVLENRFEPSETLDFNALNQKEWRNAHGQVYELNTIKLSIDARQTQVWQVMFFDLSNERLAQTERNELMTFLSHDLRSPQVGILSLLELYELERDPRELAPLHQSIVAKVQQTLEAANNLVRMTQALGGKYALEPINALPMVYEAVLNVHAQAKLKQVSIEVDEQMDNDFEHAWINADGDLLTRAVVNLLTNAIRYSPQNSMVKVSTQALTAEHCVVIEIQDAGVGMSPSQLNQINQAMTQGKSIKSNLHLKSDAAGSLGVGLNMVSAVISRHYGKVVFDSVLGQGTCVRIYLPTFDEAIELLD